MMQTVNDRSVFNGQHLLYGIADSDYVAIAIIASYMYSYSYTVHVTSYSYLLARLSETS